ncbi:MAG TPA: hypothetical protein DCX21_01060 [Eubacterium sp.]|nr:hypothetical protein [Eubacterium sp.]
MKKVNICLRIANIICLLFDVILGGFLYTVAIDLFLQEEGQDGFLILILAVWGFIWLFIDIAVSSHIGIKGRHPIAESFLMKLGSAFFMFGLGFIPLSVSLREDLKLIFVFCVSGCILFLFGVVFYTYDPLLCKVSNNRFKGYCAEWFLQDALNEYLYVKGEKKTSDLSVLEREHIKLYACMPIIYFYRWLHEMGFVKNPKGLDVLSLLKKNNYRIYRSHLSKDILGFVDSYYSRNDNYYWLDDFFVTDYYRVICGESHIYYVNEYTDSDYYKVKTRIDEAYTRYLTRTENRRLVSDIEGDIFKDINIYTYGDVNLDYVNACLKDYTDLDKTACQKDINDKVSNGNNAIDFTVSELHIYEPIDSIISYTTICKLVYDNGNVMNCEAIVSNGKVIYVYATLNRALDDTHSAYIRQLCEAYAYNPNNDEALYAQVIPDIAGGDMRPSNTMYLPKYFMKYKDKFDTFCEYHKLHSDCDIVAKPYYEEGIKTVKRLVVVMKCNNYERILAQISLWG